jgi:hypothetical protein
VRIWAQSVGDEYSRSYAVDDEAADSWTVSAFVIVGSSIKIDEANMGVGATESELDLGVCGLVMTLNCLFYFICHIFLLHFHPIGYRQCGHALR